MIQILFYFLYFLSGIFLHMSLLHLFSFYETQHHPMIAKAKKPYLASKIWGVVQLFFGLIILVLCKYQFGLNLPTILVFTGFGFWAIFLGIFSGKPHKKNNEK